MENNQNSIKKFSFKNKQNWSINRFAWVYAISILLFVIALGIIFKLSGIYESMALRTINIFFILVGFYVMIWDYKKAKKQNLDFIDAFFYA